MRGGPLSPAGRAPPPPAGMTHDPSVETGRLITEPAAAHILHSNERPVRAVEWTSGHSEPVHRRRSPVDIGSETARSLPLVGVSAGLVVPVVFRQSMDMIDSVSVVFGFCCHRTVCGAAQCVV